MTGLMCIIGFVCGFIVYRTGVKDGQKISSGAKLKGLMPKKEVKSEEEERLSKGMENILNYSNRRKKGEIYNG